MAKKFIVETSARHVHLTAEAFATLFGEGKELTVKKMLSHRRPEEVPAECFHPRPVPEGKSGRTLCNRCSFYWHCCSDSGIWRCCWFWCM